MSKISIIVPIFNVEEYLEQCIRSIISQTLTDIEIILVNDGSADNCGRICDEWGKKDSRIRVIHKENRGVSDARNTGIAMARSEWIGFVDSDDYIESQMFESMLKAGESMNSDIVCCNFSLLYKDKAITNKTIFNNDYKVSSRNEAMVHIAKGNINTFAISKLYRRMLFNDIRYPLVKTMEDVYTTHKLFQAANSVTSTGRAFYYYRQRRSSLTGVINEEFCKNLFEAHLMRIEDYLALNLFIAESEYPNLVFSLMRLHAIANSKTLKGQIKEALIKWKAICGIRLTGFKGVILSFALNLLFINENMFDLIWNSVHKFMHYIKKRNSSLYA